MADQTNQQAQMPPGPDPALKKLDFFVGTWSMKGRTLGANEDNVKGETTFKWLPGGFFLEQRVKIDFSGFSVSGLELIGYDPATGKYPSTVYSGMMGNPIPYTYEIDGRNVTIKTDLAGGATFHGQLSADGKTYSGGWRPNPGVDNPGNVAYDISGTRIK